MRGEGQRLFFLLPDTAGRGTPPPPSDGIPHPCWELHTHQPVLGSLLCLGKAHCACMNLLFLKPEKARGVRGESSTQPGPAGWANYKIFTAQTKPIKLLYSGKYMQINGTFVHGLLHLSLLKVPHLCLICLPFTFLSPLAAASQRSLVWKSQ